MPEGGNIPPENEEPTVGGGRLAVQTDRRARLVAEGEAHLRSLADILEALKHA